METQYKICDIFPGQSDQWDEKATKGLFGVYVDSAKYAVDEYQKCLDDKNYLVVFTGREEVSDQYIFFIYASDHEKCFAAFPLLDQGVMSGISDQDIARLEHATGNIFHSHEYESYIHEKHKFPRIEIPSFTWVVDPVTMVFDVHYLFGKAHSESIQVNLN